MNKSTLDYYNKMNQKELYIESLRFKHFYRYIERHTYNQDFGSTERIRTKNNLKCFEYILKSKNLTIDFLKDKYKEKLGKTLSQALKSKNLS